MMALVASTSVLGDICSGHDDSIGGNLTSSLVTFLLELKEAVKIVIHLLEQ